MHKSISTLMQDGNLKQTAEDLGITYSQDNVLCYPDIRTKAAFMTACYGNYSQAEQLIKERKKQ